MEPLIYPVILSGGSGTRLWPLSRLSFPKQFLDLFGTTTLFQRTCGRVVDDQFSAPIILSNTEHRFIIQEQLHAIGCSAKSIVLEPVGRNTAPAVLISALLAEKIDKNKLILVMPSDHLIDDEAAFLSEIKNGVSAAQGGRVVVYGIQPTSPHTGYGYIEVSDEKFKSTLMVNKFHEKPNIDDAEAYLSDGHYFWNAGIFLFKAQTMIDLFAEFEPEMLAFCRQALDSAENMNDGFVRLSEGAYQKCANISIDYAIIEKASNVSCVPLACGWNDLGSWASVTEVAEGDEDGNSSRGDVIFHQSKNCYVHSDRGAKVAVVGLEDVVAVATKDAVLLSSKDMSEEVKFIVEQIKRDECSSAVHHTRVYRPWGWYESLEKGQRFQVKCLMVKPGAQLSLQSHHHRAEHWVVVSGSVRVTNDDNVTLLSENESTYIPVGSKHRLENPGMIPAKIIEVQTGSYLGEDDIVRYEDVYKRTTEDA